MSKKSFWRIGIKNFIAGNINSYFGILTLWKKKQSSITNIIVINSTSLQNSKTNHFLKLSSNPTSPANSKNQS